MWQFLTGQMVVFQTQTLQVARVPKLMHVLGLDGVAHDP
jgi:hypothetical protein